jgi:hypothetical protein
LTSTALFLGIQSFCSRLAFHSSLNLLKFDLSGTFILLHLSIVLCVAGSVLLIYTLFQTAARSGNRPRLYPFLFFMIQGAVLAVYGKNKLGLFLLQFVALGSLAAQPLFKKAVLRKSIALAVLLLQVFFIYGILHVGKEPLPHREFPEKHDPVSGGLGAFHYGSVSQRTGQEEEFPLGVPKKS